MLFLPILSATSTFDSCMSDKLRVEIIRLEIQKQDAQFIRESVLHIIDDRIRVDILLSNVSDEHLVYMEHSRTLFGIPKDIFYRVIFKESTFHFDVTSPVGAYGYMQIMPTTLDWINNQLPFTLDYDNPLDNIFGGSYYLKWNKLRMDKRYPQLSEELRWIMALSSYNAGPSVYRKAMNKYLETIDYIDFVMRKYNGPIYDSMSY